MYLKFNLLCSIGLLIVGSVSGQVPQGQPSQQPQQQQPMPSTQGASPDIRPSESTIDPFSADKKFVKDAAEGSLTEVELGKLAQEKGSSEAVKEFGSRMVEDHGKASQELQQLATKTGLEVPSELPRKAKKAHEKLAKLSGPEFDKAYAKMMMNDHKGDAKSFDRQAKDGKIPEVKEFAAKNLPTIQEHKKLAEQLEASTK